MAGTVTIPLSLFKKMSKATQAFQDLEDEFENFLLASNPEFVAKMRSARRDHVAGKTKSLQKLKKELCIE